MCRAAATGAVDFTRADPDNRRWWINLNARLDQVEAIAIEAVYRLHHAMAVALLSRPGLTDDSYAKLTDRAESMTGAIRQLRLPWLARDNRRDDEITTLANQWRANWGDPNDPETAANIDATVAAMAAQLAASTAAAAPVAKHATKPKIVKPRPAKRRR